MSDARTRAIEAAARNSWERAEAARMLDVMLATDPPCVHLHGFEGPLLDAYEHERERAERAEASIENWKIGKLEADLAVAVEALRRIANREGGYVEDWPVDIAREALARIEEGGHVDG